MADPITILLGGVVARAVLRVWLGDEGTVSNVASDLTSLLERYLPDAFVRRSAEREINAAADKVAKKLEPFFASELTAALADNEREAAAVAVEATLAASLDGELLLAGNLDAEALRRSLRASETGRRARVGLGDAATALYDLVLAECCSYVVEISSQLPGFGLASMRELLRRDDQLIALVTEVLERLPTADARALASDEHEARWEQMYRRKVASELGRLSLFGLDLDPRRKRYALESAYVTLKVSVPSLADDNDENGGQRTSSIDEALADQDRALIRGEAGGGKTTLLQWLAVLSAEGRFEGPLAGWNGTVPFFLRLRHVDGELPRPEQFVDQIAPSLAGNMPTGYVHEKLISGEALVLVDGVDELPEGRRDAARAWLEDLLENYPSARYVVTSRPPAAADDWLASSGVDSCLLEAMDPGDVRRFVGRWYETAAEELDGEAIEERDDLLALAQRLLERIEREASLRELAGTPLLCAMLCALGRDRGVEIPVERTELYRIALDMLLHRRDADRQVPLTSGPTLVQKRRLLQYLAFWLARNEHVEVEFAMAAERFATVLEAMPDVEESAEEVLRQLLLRAGVLQEPIPGTLVFLHRTFLEYLAALQIVDEDEIGYLVSQAHRDSWREIVLLAAGAGKAHQWQRLVEGLIERGDDQARDRQVLHLLAAACAELTPGLPPALTVEVTGRLRRLVPPRTLSDANGLAAAGALAVPLLGRRRGRFARVDAACVRALGKIGGEEALQQLAPYGDDRRQSVQQELVRAWSSFDRDRFAEEVLGETVWYDDAITIDDPAVLPALGRLANSPQVVVRLTKPAASDLAALRQAPGIVACRLEDGAPGLHDLGSLHEQRLVQLALADIDDLRSLAGAEAHPLALLSIDRCRELEDISALAFTPVFDLELSALPSVVDLTPIGAMRELRRLRLHGFGGLDLGVFAMPPELRTLALAYCDGGLATGRVRLAGLTGLSIEDCRLGDLRWLEAPALQTLDVSRSPLQRGPGRRLPSLLELRLLGFSVHTLEGWICPSLEMLTIADSDIETLDGLDVGASLHSVSLDDCPALRDINALASCTGLRWLRLMHGEIERIDALRGLPIERLDLTGNYGIRDFSPLRDLPELTEIVAPGLEAEIAGVGCGHLLARPAAGRRRMPERSRMPQRPWQQRGLL